MKGELALAGQATSYLMARVSFHHLCDSPPGRRHCFGAFGWGHWHPLGFVSGWQRAACFYFNSVLITVSPLVTLVSGGLNKHCFSRIHLPIPRPALSVLVTSSGGTADDLETYRWPVVPVFPGLWGSQHCRTFSAKTRKVPGKPWPDGHPKKPTNHPSYTPQPTPLALSQQP